MLKKVLYRLGLDENAFNTYEEEISALLNFRNEIAHGFRERGIDEVQYKKLQVATFKIMEEVKTFVYEGLRLSSYRR